MFSSRFLLPDTSPTELYTLSLHDALPISVARVSRLVVQHDDERAAGVDAAARDDERLHEGEGQLVQLNFGDVHVQIGRASCRERGRILVVVGGQQVSSDYRGHKVSTDVNT